MTALTACGGSDSQPTEAERTTVASQDSPAASTVVGETAQRRAGGPPPPELQGTWLRKTERLGPIRLYIRENRYTISAGGSGQGAIVVDRDELVLFNSTAPSCRALKFPEGVGRYRWSIAAGKLHLSRIGRDPCGARADLLSNTTFQRIG